MSVTDGPGRAALLSRVQGILTKPAEEWDKIAAEPASVDSLLIRYAAILALVPAFASLIGGLYPHFGFNPLKGVLWAVIGTALSVGAIYLSAMIIDFVSDRFQTERNFIGALKLAAYAVTPIWVAGILILLPWFLRPLFYLAMLYSLYLIWVGVPKLLKPPADQAAVFSLVCMLAIGGLQTIAYNYVSWY